MIDDQQDSFPTAELKDSGYRIDYWSRLDASGLRRLEQGEYDIIVLDIQGIVAPDFSDTGDGLGVLRRLKRWNPAQVVVAFSGQSYTLDSMEFYRLADATLSKPVKTIGCMEMLDDLMQNRIGATKYWDGIQSILTTAGVSADKIRKLELAVARAAQKGLPMTTEKVEAIVGHIGTIATVAELLTKVARRQGLRIDARHAPFEAARISDHRGKTAT